MNAPPVGIASAWSTIRADAVQQALEIAVLRQQAKADKTVLDMIETAAEAGPPPAPEGQGRQVDLRFRPLPTAADSCGCGDLCCTATFTSPSCSLYSRRVRGDSSLRVV